MRSFSLSLWFVFSTVAPDVLGQIPFDTVVVDSSGPTDPWMKAIGDIDGDGQLDLLATGRSGPVVWYRFPDWAQTVIFPSVDGGTSTDMEVGDIDGDGDLDVILANGKWFENPRPGASPLLGPWVQHTIDSARAHDVFLADFDRDGDLDVVKRDQGSAGNMVRLFRQDGPDSWIPRTLTAPTGEGLFATDMDADGDPDIIIGGIWYENTGDIVNGSWLQHIYTDTYTYSLVVVTVADIDRDGRQDILLAPSESGGSNYRISWFHAPLDPRSTRFTEHVIQDVVETVRHSLMVADIDNDLDPDVVTAEMHQSVDPDEVAVLFNEGNGSSWTKQVLSNQGSHNIQLGDVDDDGDMDVFGANWNSGAPDGAVIRLWRNRLDSGPPALPLDRWERHVIDASRPWSAIFIDAGDMDTDGYRDIVTGGWWYKNPGNTSGSWTRNAFGGSLNNMAAVYDFDQDGDLDVLGTGGQGSSPNDSFVWARNDGVGSFDILTNIVNGDGDFLQGVAVDQFSSGGPTEVILSWHVSGKGIQTLTLPSNPSVGTWDWHRISDTSQDEQVSSGDIDRDGDKDLLLGTKWMRNDDPVWSVFDLTGVSGNPDRNRLVDINGDGRLDAVVGYEAISTLGKLAWYEQPAIATDDWAEHIIANVIGPMSLDVSDMDDDGDPDVVVGEHNLSDPSSARLYVLENADGVGTVWNPFVVHTGDEHHDGARIVDIDNDGDKDIVSIGWGHSRVLLYENKALDGPQASVATPVISPASGSFTGSVTVNISVSTPGAEIYYSTDGSIPDITSVVYAAPFVLSNSMTVKARAFKTGLEPSDIDTAVYTITVDNTPPTLVSASAYGNPNSVEVVFSEVLEAASGGSAQNYAISQGITVVKSTLGTDSRTVTLQTSTLSPNVTYLITVNDVRDTSENVIDANSVISFAFVEIDVSQGLVAYWPFDEGIGASTLDASGNGNTGILNGPTWTANGKMENALLFDGTNDSVDTGALDVAGNALTIALWFNANSYAVNDARLISKATSSAEQDHYWMVSTIDSGGEKLRFRLKTNGATSTLIANSGALAAGQWIHVVAVYDGGTMKLFKDGAEVGSVAKSGVLSTNSNIQAAIGRNPDGYGPFDGIIDEVRVYDRALTAEEIAILSSGLPPLLRPPRKLRIQR